MSRCEDYPCCGHGESGDGGPCPDDNGHFPCLGCGKKPYDIEVTGSSYCSKCLSDPKTFHDPECPGCETCMDEDDWDEDADDEKPSILDNFDANAETVDGNDDDEYDGIEDDEEEEMSLREQEGPDCFEWEHDIERLKEY